MEFELVLGRATFPNLELASQPPVYLCVYMKLRQKLNFKACFWFCGVVLQLCYNNLTGSIPREIGSLKKLSVLALQSNKLSGAIPASLGDLNALERLDLSYNHLFGSVPGKLAAPPLLRVLDIRNNSLSGNVPPGNNILFPSHYAFV